LTRLGAHVTVCGPVALLPSQVEKLGVHSTTRLEEALSDADFIYALRIQKERQGSGLFPSIREYVKLFRIDRDSLRFAPDHALVLHPGPINRDLELSTEVADGSRSLVLRQVTNGVAIRMAVMHLLANSRTRQ
jgi:aspartate carbamoyltransferase catalytic subunit